MSSSTANAALTPLHRLGGIPLAQLFVNLWNITDWYAKDFLHVTKEAMDGLLS